MTGTDRQASGPPPSQKAVANILQPGTHITKNGGKCSYTVSRVEHAVRDGRWITTVVVKQFANRNLTDGGCEAYLWPVRLLDGWITIINDGWIDVITAEQAAQFEAECAATWRALYERPRKRAVTAPPTAAAEPVTGGCCFG
ncbi:hypothetical protein [Azospirillum sp. sgz302134]